jgi:hypothetical protein
MSFEFIAPSIDEGEAAKLSASVKAREATGPGTYKLAVASVSGRTYEKDGETREMLKVYFVHSDDANSNLYGVEQVFFRPNGDKSKTTNQHVIAALATASGATEIGVVNWAVDADGAADDRGNLPAALLASGEELSVKGTEFIVTLEEDQSEYGQAQKEKSGRAVLIIPRGGIRVVAKKATDGDLDI